MQLSRPAGSWLTVTIEPLHGDLVTRVRSYHEAAPIGALLLELDANSALELGLALQGSAEACRPTASADVCKDPELGL